MKNTIFILTLAVAIFTTGACNNVSKKHETTNTVKKKGKYYCTMHPGITSDNPGVCPKCGMEMAERDSVGK